MNLAWPTLLHVEDDSGDKELFEHACASAQVCFNLLWVKDGEAALEYLSGTGTYADREKHPLPRLLLLDLKMPRKGGFEVLEWLRRQPNLKWLPVIIFSASNSPADVKRAFELGANSFLVKPTAFTDLVEIARLLHRYWFRLNQWPE